MTSRNGLPTTSSRSESSGDGVLVVHTAFSSLRWTRRRACGPDRGAAHGCGRARHRRHAQHERRRRAAVRSAAHAVRRNGDRRRHVLAHAWREPQRQPARLRSDRPACSRNHGAASYRRAARARQPGRARLRAGRGSPVARRRSRCEHHRAPRRESRGSALQAAEVRNRDPRRPARSSSLPRGRPLLRELRAARLVAGSPRTSATRLRRRRAGTAASARATSSPRLSITCARTKRCSCIRPECARSATKRAASMERDAELSLVCCVGANGVRAMQDLDKRSWLVPATASLALMPTVAGASGFALLEQSASRLGTAFAGTAAAADDATTVFFNPAGMTSLRQPEAVVSASGIDIGSEFRNDSSIAGVRTTARRRRRRCGRLESRAGRVLRAAGRRHARVRHRRQCAVRPEARLRRRLDRPLPGAALRDQDAQLQSVGRVADQRADLARRGHRLSATAMPS